MWSYVVIALAVFGIDQWSKWEAVRYLSSGPLQLDSYLNLALVYNRGAAFGFLSNASGWQNVFFEVVAALMVVAILWFLARAKNESRLLVVALMFILGGALGNLTDRLRIGQVVDFIDFHIGSWHWYTFNLADSAITLGAILLAVDALVSRNVATGEGK